MIKQDFEHHVDEWTFEHADHTVVVDISVEYKTKSPAIRTYGSRDGGYYNIVQVYGIPTDEFAPGVDKDDVYTVKKRTSNFIRQSPSTPNFTVPEDPDISAWKRFLTFFSDYTVEDLKRQERQRLQKLWNEQKKPAGPAVPISQQVEETTMPVLEKIDVQSSLSNRNVEIEVDVTMDYMMAEAETETETEDIDAKLAALIEDTTSTESGTHH